MPKQCVVLNEDLRLVFEGTAEEIEAWLEENDGADEFYIYMPEPDRLVTVPEFREICK